MNALIPFGLLYGRIMDVRNRLYDRGVLKSYSLGARTISIGNLTTGGTGKTPLVALVAEMLAENGEKVCVLTRGYGRANQKERVLVSDGESVLADAVSGGDEPVELARKLQGKAVVVADADRVAAAAWAKEKFGITAFVLDDGFQHRRAKRDLDLVCFDATNPCGNGRILPAGNLRESFKELRRANAIVITRSNLVDSVEELTARLRQRNAEAPIFKASTRITRITELDDFLNNSGGEVDIKEIPVFAFCGLGNPENFRRQLVSQEIKVAGLCSIGDHYRYAQPDTEFLQSEAKRFDAEALITTAKDAVKLERLKFEMPVFVAEAEVVIEEAETFRKLVLSKAQDVINRFSESARYRSRF